MAPLGPRTDLLVSRTTGAVKGPRTLVKNGSSHDYRLRRLSSFSGVVLAVPRSVRGLSGPGVWVGTSEGQCRTNPPAVAFRVPCTRLCVSECRYGAWVRVRVRRVCVCVRVPLRSVGASACAVCVCVSGCRGSVGASTCAVHVRPGAEGAWVRLSDDTNPKPASPGSGNYGGEVWVQDVGRAQGS